MRSSELIGTMTIPNGQTASNVLPATASLSRVFGACVDYIVYAPSTLTNTVSVQVAQTDSPSAGDWKTVSVGGSDITVGAGKAVVVPVGGIRAMRLLSSGAEGAQRDFSLMGQIENSL